MVPARYRSLASFCLSSPCNRFHKVICGHAAGLSCILRMIAPRSGRSVRSCLRLDHRAFSTTPGGGRSTSTGFQRVLDPDVRAGGGDWLSIQLLVRGGSNCWQGAAGRRPPIYKREARNPYVLLYALRGGCAAPGRACSSIAWLRTGSRVTTDATASRISNTILFWNIGGKAREGWGESLRSIDADLVVCFEPDQLGCRQSSGRSKRPEATPDSGTPAAERATPDHCIPKQRHDVSCGPVPGAHAAEVARMGAGHSQHRAGRGL